MVILVEMKTILKKQQLNSVVVYPDTRLELSHKDYFKIKKVM